MPYVQRDYDGKVKGLFRQLQQGYAEEWLPEEHPDVAEYHAKHPRPPIPLTAETREDLRRAELNFEAREKEIEALNKAILAHMRAWANLETALSCLLYAILDIQPHRSRMAYAIYYSLNGFDARQRMVDNVIIQFIDETPDCIPLREHWAQINDMLIRCTKIRNKVAHGSPIIFVKGTKQDVRLAPPAFDVNKVERLINKGSDPGLTAGQIREAVTKIDRLVEYIDIVNSVIAGYRRHGPATLPKTLPALEACLQSIRPATADQSRKSDAQTPEEPPRRPESS